VTVSDRDTDVTRYSRLDTLRILRIRARQLNHWERNGIIAASEDYGFQDLVKLRKLRDLCATPISAASIRTSLDAMKRVSGMANPLIEASAFRNGTRLAFRHSGMVVDPVRQQFLLDFEAAAAPEMRIVGKPAARPTTVRTGDLFLQAVQLEDDSGSMREAMQLYEEILAAEPAHAPACINLGTIYYNQRQFAKAESLYRRATVADPHYALAFFDLGNVLDELKRLPDAIASYRTAISLVPTYADAHYNLALALERQGEPRRALRHWMIYSKLDPVGPWANHARGQAKKILGLEKLAIVHRGTRSGGPTTFRTA
jgi:tetratricopeptide (TPR) repeat protein